VESGEENCLYLGGEYQCSASRPLVETQYFHGDVPTVTTQVDCVEVNGACQTPAVPSGVAVEAGGDTNETAYFYGPAAGAKRLDIPETCVEFGATCD
jgi:hypothetical protein